MNDLLWALLFLLLSLLFAVSRKVYLNYLPNYELKRRAQNNESPSRELYKAVAYDKSLYTLLDLRLGITTAASLVLLVESSLSPWVSWLLVILVLGFVFWLIPVSPVTSPEVWLTLRVSPILLWFLSRLHNSLDRLSQLIAPLRADEHKVSRIYEKEDLIKILKQQSADPFSRLDKHDLTAAEYALSFNDHLVSDNLTPLKSVKTVLASDTLGPILIDEIHKSKQAQVLVKDKKKGKIIGSLSFSQLGLESRGKVEDVMDKQIYYLNEKDSLTEVVRAYFKTNRSLFVVINSAEEMVGVITVKDAIQKLLGSDTTASKDFDGYINSGAVAARHTNKETVQNKLQSSPVKTDD